MSNGQDTEDATPADWDGVYYDAASGQFVTVNFQQRGAVTLQGINDADESDPVHTFTTSSQFREDADLSPVPQSALDDPASVALQAYNRGYEQYTQHGVGGPQSDIAMMYADTQIEISETE